MITLTPFVIWALAYRVRNARLMFVAVKPRHGTASVPVIEFVIAGVSLVVRYIIKPGLWTTAIVGGGVGSGYGVWVLLDWALS